MRIGTDENSGTGTALMNREILFTGGIRTFLLRRSREQTLQWLDMVYSVIPDLSKRWCIRSLLPNQFSRYGIVLHARTETLGNVISQNVSHAVAPSTSDASYKDGEMPCNAARASP